MATLEKIRSKGVFLLIVVGLALLAFLLGDFLNSGSTFFSQRKNKIAVVNGENIKIENFMADLDQFTNVYKIEMGEENMDEETTEQIRQQVWENTIRKEVLTAETENLGMTITNKELYEFILGNNIHPMIQARKVFFNQEGTFDPQILGQFISLLDDPEANMTNEIKSYWSFWENAVKNNALEEKYSVLLSRMMVANSLDAKQNIEYNKNMVDILYAVEPYSAIPDSAIQISDKEIKTYYKNNKKQYKKDLPTCNIDYVVFDIAPRKGDFETIESWINGLIPEFKSTTEIASFINSNSDNRYNHAALSEKEVPAELRSFAFSKPNGEVYGPYFTNGSYKIAKIVDNTILVPDSVKVRHIYVAEETKERSQELADSLLRVLRNGADFTTLAKTFSRIPQTAENGGEIGWVKEADLEEVIANKVFNAKKNEIFSEDAGMGIQIFQVTDLSAKVKKVKLAIVEREVIASSRTQAEIFAEAKQFAAESKNTEVVSSQAEIIAGAEKSSNIISFRINADKQGLKFFPDFVADINSPKVGTINNSRQVVRWAFEQKNATISDVFECDDKFVVAAVYNINKEDYKSLDEVKEDIKNTLLKEKKGDFIVEKIGSETIDNLITKGMKVDTLENITFEMQNLPKVGMEPKLFAAATSGKEVLVKGNSGVFIFKNLSSFEPNPNQSVAETKMMINSQNAYMIPYMSMEALIQKAEIEDNRAIVF